MINGIKLRNICRFTLFAFICLSAAISFASEELLVDREESEKKEWEEHQRRFEWWPTDATPGPVKDEKRGGYWWWPTRPGKIGPLWGNRGYVYVFKIIFDYKEEELPPPKPQELRPSLLIKKIIRNVKIYFDYDKADLRDDALVVLESAVSAMKRYPEASILITGNCDMRGSEQYNVKLGRRRAEVVKDFMLEKGSAEERIRIVSRGKLDAIAPIADLVGMQKDRNAQFMIAEVEEVMLPYAGEPKDVKAEPVGEGKYLVEEEQKAESEIRVSTREYTVKKGDTLSGIARREYGGAHRWKYLYELNKDRIKNPDKLKVGQKIIIPVE